MNSLKVFDDQKETSEEKKEEEEKNKDTAKDLFPEEEEEQQQDNSPSKWITREGVDAGDKTGLWLREALGSSLMEGPCILCLCLSLTPTYFLFHLRKRLSGMWVSVLMFSPLKNYRGGGFRKCYF